MQEDGVLTIDHVGLGVSKWIWAIQEIAKLVVARVTGSGSDSENIALQSTETSLAFVSGAGERNYHWESCLEGLILVANLRTKMGRGRV